MNCININYPEFKNLVFNTKEKAESVVRTLEQEKEVFLEAIE